MTLTYGLRAPLAELLDVVDDVATVADHDGARYRLGRLRDQLYRLPVYEDEEDP